MDLTEQQRRVLGVEFARARRAAGYRQISDLARKLREDGRAAITAKTIGKLERGTSVAVATVETLAPYVGWSEDEWERRARHGTATAPLRSATEVDASNRAWDEVYIQEKRRVQLIERIRSASRELAQAADELAAMEIPEGVSSGSLAHPTRLAPLDDVDALAAYRTGTPSSRERLDAAQDEAAEAPDAPGPEHGA